MNQAFEESLAALGVKLTAEELDVLRPLFIRYVAGLERLRAHELSQPEPPVTFSPRLTERPF